MPAEGAASCPHDTSLARDLGAWPAAVSSLKLAHLQASYSRPRHIPSRQPAGCAQAYRNSLCQAALLACSVNPDCSRLAHSWPRRAPLEGNSSRKRSTNSRWSRPYRCQRGGKRLRAAREQRTAGSPGHWQLLPLHVSAPLGLVERAVLSTTSHTPFVSSLPVGSLAAAPAAATTPCAHPGSPIAAMCGATTWQEREDGAAAAAAAHERRQ